MKAAPGKNPETALDQGHDTAQITLTEYLDVLNVQVREHGEEAVRLGDPDAFSGALKAIRDAAAEFGSFNADDVAWPLRGNEVGAAFAHLRRLGEIECCGYAVSRRPKAHGRLVRIWRAT